MSQEEFSELVKGLAQKGNRRAGIRAAVAGALTAAVAKVQTAGAQEDAAAENNKRKRRGPCTPVGRRCGPGSGHRGKPCRRCCSGYATSSRPGAALRCTLRPDGFPCNEDSQCASGECINGTCGLVT